MKKIWKYCINKKWKMATKRNVFLLINVTISFILSIILWVIAKSLIIDFDTIGWLICFIGYSMVIDYIAGIIFIYNHEWFCILLFILSYIIVQNKGE